MWWIAWNCGGLICFTKSTLQKVGYFKEDIEWRVDANLNRRITNVGLKPVYVDVECLHLPSFEAETSLSLEARARARDYKRWKDETYAHLRQNPPPFRVYEPTSVTKEQVEQYLYTPETRKPKV